MKKVTRVILFILFLISLPYLGKFNVKPVKGWTGTVYIRSDGSIDPVTAPISIVGNFSYILTGDIYGSLIIQRTGAIIDGANHTIQKPDGTAITIQANSVTLKGVVITESSTGIMMIGITGNNVIYNNTIIDNQYGIQLSGDNCLNNLITANIISKNIHGILLEASDNRIYGNKITWNTYGIHLKCRNSEIFAVNNEIIGNDIIKNTYGIFLDGYDVYRNLIYHNNFIDNVNHIFFDNPCWDEFNSWDDGYPSGGNYWDDYAGIDADSDGIGDEPYFIREASEVIQDRYPLIAPIKTFYVGTWQGMKFFVDIISNSTISDFYFNLDGKFISFNVTGENGTIGFCRVTIPKDLLWVIDGWKVLINGQPVNYTILPHTTNTYLSFNYQHSTKNVIIQGTHAIPELPSTITLLPLLIFTALLAIVTKKRLLK